MLMSLFINRKMLNESRTKTNHTTCFKIDLGIDFRCSHLKEMSMWYKGCINQLDLIIL
jgi:hypothetical protein